MTGTKVTTQKKVVEKLICHRQTAGHLVTLKTFFLCVKTTNVCKKCNKRTRLLCLYAIHFKSRFFSSRCFAVKNLGLNFKDTAR